MNILFTYIRKYLIKNSMSTLVTIFSISCASALFFIVVCLGINTYKGIDHSLINFYGNYHAMYSNVTDEFVTALHLHTKVDNVNTVEFKEQFYIDKLQSNDKDSLYLLGIDEDTFKDLGLQLVEGRYPTSSNEIIISNQLANHNKIELEMSSTITLDDKKYTVVGLVSQSFFEDDTSYYTLLTINEGVGIKNAYVRYINQKDIHESTNQIVSSFIDQFKDIHINNHMFLYNNANNSTYFIISLFMIGFITFLFMNILLLVNCYKNSYANREKHLAILKTIGVTQSQCKTMIMYEGILLLMISLVVGLLCGWFGYDILVHIINNLLLNISVDIFKISSEYKLFVLILTIIFVTTISLISIHRGTKKIISQTVTITFQSSDEVFVMDSPYLELEKNRNIMIRLLKKNIRQNKRSYSPLILGITTILSAFIFVNSLMGYLREDLFVNSYDQNYDVEIVIYNDTYPTSLMTQLKNAGKDLSYVISEKIVVDTKQIDLFDEEYLDLIVYDDFISIDLLTYSDVILKDFLPNREIDLYNNENPIGILIDETYSLAQRKYYDILIEDSSLSLWSNNELIIDSLDIYTTDTLITGTKYQKNPQIIVNKELFSQIYNCIESDNHEYHIYYQSNNTSSLMKELNSIDFSQVQDYTIHDIQSNIKSGKVISVLIRVISYGYVCLLTIMALLTMSCVTSINFDYRKKEFMLYRVIGLRFVEMMQLIFWELVYYLTKLFLYSWIISQLLNYLVYILYFQNIGLKFFIPNNSIIGSIALFLFVLIIFMNYIYIRMSKQKYTEVLKNEISMI